MYFRKERRFTSRMKYRRFFSFLTLCLLSSTVASAHNTVLTLRQDDAAILRPYISALAVLCGWVVDGKKDPQQVRKGHNGWVIADLHNLGMAVQGPKSVFETLFRSKAAGGPQVVPNPVADAAVQATVADTLAANAKRAYPKPNLTSKQPPTAEAAVDLLGGFRPVTDAQRTGVAKMLAEAQQRADVEYAKKFANRLANRPSGLLLPGSTAEERAADALAAAEAKAQAAASAANGRKPRTPRQKAEDSNK
jgi:hypothetical protein